MPHGLPFPGPSSASRPDARARTVLHPLVAGFLGLWVSASPITAQTRPAPWPTPEPPQTALIDGFVPGAQVAPASAAGRSLVLPGWGQLALGQRRAWGYLAVEVALWAYWADRRSAGADARRAYRDLAWSRARLAAGVRVDGDWAYYETLEEWTRSGAYDADPSRPGVQPEQDATSFNGYVWSLARGQYLPGDGPPDEGDPRYTRALAYYEERAYGAAYLWDWSGKEGELARYKGLIRESDDRFQRATTALGAVLANHFLSATDAFLSARLPGEAGLRVVPGSALGPRGWTVGMNLRPAR